ncbi:MULTISPECIES: NYN domain-containing protein [unclassified Devosia]|uniref:NYN domain-containing protein n=1 Tax=unclassified Devosia TaxID=196773 RepID=UPI001558283C|nr:MULTISPECIES: NYN domain-containing protein [unclassified Devosia]
MRQIAVLFDAENIGAGCIEPALSQLAQRGQVTTAKAVGDFAEPTLGPWRAEASRHGLMLVLQPSLGKGKNAADIRLAIEAMNLAHRGQVDTIALVSNDRDFTPLALHLRDMGLDVHGFGTGKAPEAFQAACTSFTSIPNLDCASPTKPPAGVTSVMPAQGAKPAPTSKKAPPVTTPPQAIALSPAERQEIINIVQAVSDTTTGGADLAQIGSKLAQANPPLFKRLTGGKGLRQRLVNCGIVEQMGSQPSRVRLIPLRIVG